MQAPLDVVDWLEHAGDAWRRADGSGCAARGRRSGPRRARCSRGAPPARRRPCRRRSDRPSRRPARAPLDDLAGLHAHWLAAANSRRSATATAGAGGSPTRRSPRRWGPIALAAVTLVTERDPPRIKECGGVACGWLFYDETKNNRPPLVRNGGLRQSRQAAPARGAGARRVKRLIAILLAAAALAGCARLVETDQARLCRMALPALSPPDAKIELLSQLEFPDGRGLASPSVWRRRPASRSFRRLPLSPARPPAALRRNDRAGDRRPAAQRHQPQFPGALLAGDARSARRRSSAARRRRALPRLPHAAAYGLQQALDGLPLAAIYALLAAAYSLVYGLVGRINLAFGDFAAAGGYAAALGALLAAGQAPATILATALALGGAAAAVWGIATSRWVFEPLRGATGQQALVATVGLALAIDEFLRLTQGNRQIWVSPMLNAPFAVARSGDFVVTSARRRPAFGRRRHSRRADAGRDDALHPLRTTLARLCRRSARRPIVRRQPARHSRPDLRARRRFRRPLRLRHDDVLRLGRLRGGDHARPQSAGRRHSRRRRLDPRRVPRRPAGGRLRGDLAGLFPGRLSRRRRSTACWRSTLVLRPGGLLGVRP